MGEVKKSLLVSELKTILNIPSPTYKEAELFKYFKKKLQDTKSFKLHSSVNSLIAVPNKTSRDLPNIALVGHLDVVPQFTPVKVKGNLIYGAGASDMKGSLACFTQLLPYLSNLDVNLSFIFYAREEMTSLEENGLNELIHKFPNYFKSLDFALIGEPTNSEVHLGCLGSIHAEVTVFGKSCHSARPWQGENALNNALPLLKKISAIKPKPHSIFGVTFNDVVVITESMSEPGTTTIPGYWKCNINYRYSPNWNDLEALDYLINLVTNTGVPKENIKIKSQAPAGEVNNSVLMKFILNKIEGWGIPLAAKQAWTDVAQISQLGIPCFNYGPGLTEKCHTSDEYIEIDAMIDYTEKLLKLFRTLY